MYQSLAKYISDYQEKGIVLIPFGIHPFTTNDFNYLASYPKVDTEYELVKQGDSGDEHDLRVLRIIKDLKSIEYCKPYSKSVANLISNSHTQDFFQSFDDKMKTIRRCQINYIPEGGFIGPHIDNHSNPNWTNVIVFHLQDQYFGGNYVVHNKGKTISIKPTKGSIIISRCDILHEVQKVERGSRKTLACFFSTDNSPNPRYN